VTLLASLGGYPLHKAKDVAKQASMLIAVAP
jgi:hypothetical protein